MELVEQYMDVQPVFEWVRKFKVNADPVVLTPLTSLVVTIKSDYFDALDPSWRLKINDEIIDERFYHFEESKVHIKGELDIIMHSIEIEGLQ